MNEKRTLKPESQQKQPLEQKQEYFDTDSTNYKALFLDSKIDETVAGLSALYSKLLHTISVKNALCVVDYIFSLKTEVNLSDNYRMNLINLLAKFSKYNNNKPFMDVTRSDIVAFLDNFRKTETADPLHKWIGTYNILRIHLFRFFKWLYYPDIEPGKRSKPAVIENIARLKQMLHFYRQCSQKEVRKTLQLQSQNVRIATLLTRFKNSNKEFIKIQFVANQIVKSAISDMRQLLKLAVYAVIESWRDDPTKFNSLIQSMSPATTISKLTMINYADSNNNHAIHFSSYYNQNSYTENLIEITVNGAAIIYKKMVRDFTNETMFAGSTLDER
jgi:hypothetical protein